MAVSQHNISDLGFEDFFRLKYQTEQLDKRQVTDVISQHDKDKVTYVEAYDVILGIIHDLSTTIQQVNDYNDNKSSASMDLTGFLIELLVKREILTEQEESDILRQVQELYSLQEEEDKEDGNTQTRKD